VLVERVASAGSIYRRLVATTTPRYERRVTVSRMDCAASNDGILGTP